MPWLNYIPKKSCCQAVLFDNYKLRRYNIVGDIMTKNLRIINIIVLTLAVNLTLPLQLFDVPFLGCVVAYIGAGIYFLWLSLYPSARKCPTFRLWVMEGGAELLFYFVVSLTLSVLPVIGAVVAFTAGLMSVGAFIAYCVILAVSEVILFWNGIIRVYCTSAQLGFKIRLLGIIFGMVPIANLVMLGIIYSKVRYECDISISRYHRNLERYPQQICRTRYPVLLVHGVFFRDRKLLNYWGRIPAELEANGCTVCYGNQQSAQSVARSAQELSERIKEICEQTGCGKVNIIAHSKGGLDSRYAVSQLGSSEYVASLTTINTPHRGCIFAEHLLGKADEKFIAGVEETYNKAYKVLGDEEPDFLSAVKDLTNSSCEWFNENIPDAEGVLYQSVGSIAPRAQSGRFPLNIFYPIVKKYDGENDGMVALSSMKWGDSFTVVYPEGERGISHGDIIDLNREDYRGFDVLEFYVQLVSSLRERGF